MSKLVKPAVFLLCLLPAAVLAWRAFHAGLGPNPIEFVTHWTGDWTLRFLLLTLVIAPARRLLGMPQLIRFRRMLGLYVFFYGSLHALTYFWLDKFFDFDEIVKDIGKRPFITAGFTAFVLLVPLALTSTRGWIRRLGGKRWQALHRLIYGSIVAAVVHYYWLVKSDVRLPLLYAGMATLLLGYRVIAALLRRRTRRAAVPLAKRRAVA